MLLSPSTKRPNVITGIVLRHHCHSFSFFAFFGIWWCNDRYCCKMKNIRNQDSLKREIPTFSVQLRLRTLLCCMSHWRFRLCFWSPIVAVTGGELLKIRCETLEKSAFWAKLLDLVGDTVLRDAVNQICLKPCRLNSNKHRSFDGIWDQWKLGFLRLLHSDQKWRSCEDFKWFVLYWEQLDQENLLPSSKHFP